jgi:hypothetical protein
VAVEEFPVHLLRGDGLRLCGARQRRRMIPKIITDRIDELLVPPGRPKALAAAVVHLLSDLPIRWRLRARARVPVRDRFDSSDIFAEAPSLYRSLLI